MPRHIVLIMTDQQRTDTIAAWGHDHMVTPHMDRIANEGVSFTGAYCPGATCIACRAAVFTGMYAHNTGVYSFDRWGHQRNWVQDLNEAGYFCANIGKMHFSPRDVDGGFHERVVVENPTNNTHAQGNADDDWGRYLNWHGEYRPNDRQKSDPGWLQKFQGVPWHLDEHLHSDVFIGTAAVSWIDNYRGDKPVFLQVGLTGPHEPWDPLPRHLELYQDKEMPKPVYRDGELDDTPPQHTAHRDHFASHGHHEAHIDLRLASPDDIDHMRRHYYAKITTVDEQVGRILDALERRGWLDDCLLVFCSDHGEMLADHMLPYKWLMYEQVVNVPLILRYPGAESRTETDLVSLIDLGPTILDAAGVEIPDHLEGRSLMPYVSGTLPDRRAYVFCQDNVQTMIRSRTHKLVYLTGQPTEGELYDLESDPDELYNRWHDPAYAAVKNELLLTLLDWLSTSTYLNSGYKQGAGKHYRTRYPSEDYRSLMGPPNPVKPKTMG